MLDMCADEGAWLLALNLDIVSESRYRAYNIGLSEQVLSIVHLLTAVYVVNNPVALFLCPCSIFHPISIII